jgi:hypothetical protein
MPADNKALPVWIDDPDTAPTARTRLPVVVVGAGPIGLAAAAHLLDRGLEPLVLEAGPQVGTSIAQWRHVRLFSPWCLALDPVSVRMLEQTGWIGPDLDALPTGGDLLDHYLKPLAGLPALSSRTRLRTTVLAVARDGVDKVRSPGRERLPFIVRIRDQAGDLHDLQARAVIDASGTWNQPNPLGASGLPALGEPEAGSRISYGSPTSSAATAHDTSAGGWWSSEPVIQLRPACSPWPSCNTSAPRRRSSGRSAHPTRGRKSARAAPKPTNSPPAASSPPTSPPSWTPVTSSSSAASGSTPSSWPALGSGWSVINCTATNS